MVILVSCHQKGEKKSIELHDSDLAEMIFKSRKIVLSEIGNQKAVSAIFNFKNK